MKQLPEMERPYEKLEIYGEKLLSNAELLAIIIKTGTKEESALNIAQKILKLNDKVKLQGYTLIPLKVYFNDRNRAKVLIGICKGKNVVDKRETEKERSIKREIDKATKNR